MRWCVLCGSQKKPAFIPVYKSNLLGFHNRVGMCILCGTIGYVSSCPIVARTRTNGRGLRKLATSSVVSEIVVAWLEPQILAVFN